MKKLSIVMAVLLVLVMIAGCTQKATQLVVQTEEPIVPTEAVVQTEEPIVPTEAVVTTPEPTAAPTAFVDEQRVLHLAVNAAIETMDAHATNNLNATWIIKQFYEGLIFYNYEDTVVEPRIAESYEMSTDGLTWTFHLRTDVKFHSGDTLTAKDVVFSYNRAIATPAMATNTKAIDSVSAPDDKTVVIKLKNTVAPFLQYVSSIVIMNEKFVTGLAGNVSTAENGTGPYKADKIDLSLGIEATAFADYYRGIANIRNIKWDVITDASASAMAFQAGDLDYLQIAYSQYSGLKADPNFEVGIVPQRHTIYVAFNSSKPPFDNVLVRQAISYMIDRQAVATVTFEGLADVDSLLMSPKLDGMPSADVLEQYMYEYNPQKGLALLREAGYDTTKPIDLGSIRTYPESHYASKPTLIIQANLAASGIKLAIETMEVNAFVEAFYGGDYTMACAAGAYGADASGYDLIFGSSSIGVVGGNPFYWSDPEVDTLFAQGVAETDPVARQAIYGKIMKILYEQAPGTGMAHKHTVVAWSKSVTPVLRMDYPMIYEWNFVAK